MSDNFEDAAHSVASLIGVVDHGLHALLGFGIDATQQDFVTLAERHEFFPRGRAFQTSVTDGDYVAEHGDAEFRQIRFRQRAHSDSRGRLTRAGPFQNIPCVLKIVLNGACEIGMAGAGTRDRLAAALGVLDIFDGQRFGPVLPVFVLDQDGDGRTDGLRVPDSADNVGLICLNFHAATAAEALLAAPQLAVQSGDGDGNSSRQTS